MLTLEQPLHAAADEKRKSIGSKKSNHEINAAIVEHFLKRNINSVSPLSSNRGAGNQNTKQSIKESPTTCLSLGCD